MADRRAGNGVASVRIFHASLGRNREIQQRLYVLRARLSVVGSDLGSAWCCLGGAAGGVCLDECNRTVVVKFVA
eukprot:1798150-Prymnesium_polylepis.1